LRKERKSLAKLIFENLKSLKFNYGINSIEKLSPYIVVVHFSKQKKFWIIVILLILSEKWRISSFLIWVLGVSFVSFSEKVTCTSKPSFQKKNCFLCFCLHQIKNQQILAWHLKKLRFQKEFWNLFNWTFQVFFYKRSKKKYVSNRAIVLSGENFLLFVDFGEQW